MVYINIPYVPENNRINKNFAKESLRVLDISESVKDLAYTAIYNLRPRGVNIENQNSVDALLLEATLKKLGVPYKISELPDHNDD